jgi:metal-sulfur cluster biosynthetic enzyme
MGPAPISATGARGAAIAAPSACGKEATWMTSPGGAGGATADRVREALRLVIDPEIGLNVVDLGLVYRVDVADGDVRVAMTMTTPACPLGETLRADAEAAIRRDVPGVRSVALELVWDPPWTPAMMSDAAKEQMGWAR